MKTIKMAVASVWGVSVLLGCAGQSAAPVQPREDAPTPTLYLAAEKSEPAKSVPTTKPTAWITGKTEQSPNHLQDPKPQLPAGHPQIPAAQGAGELPAGHPQIPAQGQLPVGHPSVEQMQAAPATQPVTFGTLTVKAVQKTAGGPAVFGDEVTVEVYDKETLIKKVTAKLDASGVAKVEQVPFGGEFGQFIRINHAGVEYTQQLEAGNEVAVNVYESTEETPAWLVKMRHMIVQTLEDGSGVRVTDVLAVENPGDRAWLGRDDGSGKRTTFAVALPAGATNVTLGGAFHDCCVKIENGKATNTMALLPGVNKYQISYTLAAAGGKVQVETNAPALINNMIVMLPDDGSSVSASGLEGPSTVNMGGGNTRFFRAQDVKAGSAMSVTMTVAGGEKATTAKTSSNINASQIGRLVAGAGGLLIFVIGGTFMFLKAPKAKRSK